MAEARRAVERAEAERKALRENPGTVYGLISSCPTLSISFKEVPPPSAFRTT